MKQVRRPSTISEELWASLSPMLKKAAAEHEKIHREYLALVTRPAKSVKK